MKAIQWRDSMRSPKLWVVDLRLFVLLLVWVFWPRVWTLVPVLCAMGFLVVVGHKGYRPGAALRALRRRVAGPVRAWAPRRYRRTVDYGVWAAMVMGAGMVGEGSARAEFLYIAPAREEVPTFAITSPAPEVGQVRVSRVAMPWVEEETWPPEVVVAEAAAGSASAGGRSGPRVMVTIRGRGPESDVEGVGGSVSEALVAAGVVEKGEIEQGDEGAAQGALEAGEVAGLVDAMTDEVSGELALAAVGAAKDVVVEADPPQVWEVSAGSTLSTVLRQWGERADVEVVMLTDRVYEIVSSHQFTGEFSDAVRVLLFGLGDLAYAPIGQMTEDGKVLAIYHRVPDGPGEVRQ